MLLMHRNPLLSNVLAIVSESVYAIDKKCPGTLFRLEVNGEVNDPSITKAMCEQHCNDKPGCNFYAHWNGGLGQGDCRGWTNCESPENLASGYKNTIYRVDRTTSGNAIIDYIFDE